MENLLNAECTHSNHPTKTMTISWLKDRVKLIVDIKSSVSTVMVDGDIKVTERNVTIGMVETLERQCEAVAIELQGKEERK